jgi:hypothetical protein
MSSRFFVGAAALAIILAHFRVRFGYTQHDEGSWRILAV